jgi:hypothetical protein
MIFLYGAIIGLASFLIAMAAVPLHNVSDFSIHDLALAVNLAYIFPPLIGFWVGFCRRSLWWILVGASVGPVLGSIYKSACGQDLNLLLIVAVMPCLLGGIAAVALGYGRGSWWDGAPLRLLKGMLSGFLLGLVYEIVLNIICAILASSVPPELATPTFEHFRLMMWVAGSVAMAVGGGVFLPLFHWSANVPRPQFRRAANEGN